MNSLDTSGSVQTLHGDSGRALAGPATDLALQYHHAEPKAAGQLGRTYLWQPVCSCGWKGAPGDSYIYANGLAHEHMDHPNNTFGQDAGGDVSGG